MQQPKMELHQLHLFEKTGMISQKPRGIVFEAEITELVKVKKPKQPADKVEV